MESCKQDSTTGSKKQNRTKNHVGTEQSMRLFVKSDLFTQFRNMKRAVFIETTNNKAEAHNATQQ